MPATKPPPAPNVVPPPTVRVECRDCRHFREFPYGSQWKRRTGCYHPELMEQRQSEEFLKEQEVPGDHEKLNLRGDCAKFERAPRKPSLLERVLEALRS